MKKITFNSAKFLGSMLNPNEEIRVEGMNVAVMGCIVNGPGESKHANIGISLPGTGESPAAPVFVDGHKTVTLRGDQIAEEFQAIVLDYVKNRYAQKESEKVSGSAS